MTRGGPRQGTPGKAYANRTDLSQAYAPQGGGRTAAAGGVTASTPAAPPAATPGVQSLNAAAFTTPDQVTPLDAPTQRPGVPVTNGLPSGPGSNTPPGMNVNADLVAHMAPHLPYLAWAAQDPDTPASIKSFVNYLQTQVSG